MTRDEQPPRRAKQAHCPIFFRLEAVRRVEAGGIQRVLAAELGVARITLIEWLRRHGTAAYAQVKRKIFTPAQKHAVARELRAGRLSEDEALLKYGIGDTLLSFAHASQQVARAVRAHNELRPHGSCDFLTPSQAHGQEGSLVRRWENYYRPAAAPAPT